MVKHTKKITHSKTEKFHKDNVIDKSVKETVEMIEVLQVIADNKTNWVGGNHFNQKIAENKAECMIKEELPRNILIEILKAGLKVDWEKG